MSTAAWLRLHRSVLNCHKVQSLPPSLFKTWVNLLCVADDDGRLPSQEAIAFALRIGVATLGVELEHLTKAGLIDKGGRLHDWDEHQFRSDSSTERSRKHRAKRSATLLQRPGNVAATPPDTDTDTDTDTDQKESPTSLRSVVPAPSAQGKTTKPKAIRIPEDFAPDLEVGVSMGLSRSQAQTQADAFRDYWRAKAGPNAVKMDWIATWRNWCRKALESGGGGARTGPPQDGNPLTAGLRRQLDILAKRGEANGKDQDHGQASGDEHFGRETLDLAPPTRTS